MTLHNAKKAADRPPSSMRTENLVVQQKTRRWRARNLAIAGKGVRRCPGRTVALCVRWTRLRFWHPCPPCRPPRSRVLPDRLLRHDDPATTLALWSAEVRSQSPEDPPSHAIPFPPDAKTLRHGRWAR